MDKVEAVDNAEGELSRQIAHEWGWATPPQEILEQAKLAYKIRQVTSQAALDILGILPPERIESLVSRKPDNVRTLDWVAQNEPVALPHIDKIRTLHAGHAYYDSVDAMTIHPAMADSHVSQRCDSISAVIVEIQSDTAAVVFSSYNEMRKFSTDGLEAQAVDPIRQALSGSKLCLAVGKHDRVIELLATARGQNETDATSRIVATWHGALATDNRERLIARVIDYALSHGATDIAITPLRGKGSQVHMRVNGTLMECPIGSHLNVEDAAVIIDLLMAKSNANPTMSKIRRPQDGNIFFRSNTHEAELRLSFMPLNQPGEYLISVSIRLLPRTEQFVTLESLNLDEQVRACISAASRLSKGFILLVGGTNTGKSTTIAGALAENRAHYGDSLKRISLERPVERLTPGVLQINIPPGIEDSFETYLKAVKRHDPDVISVGEILDGVTADVAVTAAISGHLVFSTTHANNTLLGYDSLAQMLEPNKRFQFVESLSLIVAQDMVREVCPMCGVISEPSPSEVELFMGYQQIHGTTHSLPEKTIHVSKDGCRACNNTGIKNMLPISELLQVNQKVKRAMHALLNGQFADKDGILHRDTIADERPFTLFDSAMKLVMAQRIELGDALQ